MSDANKPNVIWEFLPGAQERFIQCPVFEVLMGGTRGGGKSDALLMAYAQHVGQGYGIDWKGVIFREEYPDLEEMIDKSRKWFTQMFPDATYNQSKHIWKFKDGESLRFRHAKVANDYWGYHGSEFPFVGWEELCNWASPQLYLDMMSVCRSSNPNIPRMYRSTTNPWGCVPFGEVLTANRGWVNIKDIRIGEEVISVDSTGNIITKPVSNVIKQQYKGNMVKREGSGLYMEFTEDHRFPLLNTHKSLHTIKPFTDLPGQANIRRTGNKWKEPNKGSIVIPGYDILTYRPLKKKVSFLPTEDYASLLGWYIAEGCVCMRDGAFCIAQQKQNNVKKIKKLLDKCGFHYRYDGQAFWVSEINWMHHFGELGKAHDKYIPTFIKNSNESVLTHLLESLMAGDGCGNVYYTVSKKLADDVAEIMVKLGYAVYISQREGTGFSDSVCYEVHMSNRDTIQLQTGNHVYDVSTNSKSVDCVKEYVENKTVYCLTVPDTETFFIRQNGCVWLSGNSGHNWVKARFIDKAKPYQIYVDVHENPFTGKRLTSERCYIPSSIEENKYLMENDPQYLANLQMIKDPNKRKAWLDAEDGWNIVAGGMFDDLWQTPTHVLEPFDIPTGWRVSRSFDWGSSAPFSVGWWARSDGNSVCIDKEREKYYKFPKGTMIRINEWYGWNGEPNEGIKMSSVDIGKGIRKLENEMFEGSIHRIKKGAADDSIFDKDHNNEAIAEKISEGYYNRVTKLKLFVPAGKNYTRKRRWQLMRDRLEASHPFGLGQQMEEAGLFVFDTCRQFIRTIPTLPRDEKDLEDIDTDTEDHIADETAYEILYKPSRTGKVKTTQG